MSATEIGAGVIGWVAGVVSIVVGERLNKYFSRLKINVISNQQILMNTPNRYAVALGFGIIIAQGKELEEAFARFNNVVYPWWENGKTTARTQLLVGDEPSWISPYYMALEHIEDITKQPNVQKIIKKGNPSNHAVLFSVYEYDPDPNKNAVKNKIFERIILLPKNVKAFNIGINQLIAKFSIRLIAKGIEKPMQYTGEIRAKNLSIGKFENGVPSLDTSIIAIDVYHD